MNDCYALARELGKFIVTSEQSLRLADAKAERDGIDAAEKDYRLLVEQIIQIIVDITGICVTQQGKCGGCKVQGA
jgi:hypothetical protein